MDDELREALRTVERALKVAEAQRLVRAQQPQGGAGPSPWGHGVEGELTELRAAVGALAQAVRLLADRDTPGRPEAAAGSAPDDAAGQRQAVRDAAEAATRAATLRARRTDQ